MSNQDKAGQKKGRQRSVVKESFDAEEPPDKWTQKQRKDSADIFLRRRKAPKGRGRAPLEKFPEKKSDASAEKKQSEREDSDAFLGKRGEGAVRAEGFGCGFGRSAVKNYSNFKDSEERLGNAMKKMWNCESSKGTMVGDIAVTQEKTQTEGVAEKTQIKKTKASKKRRVSA
jgi:hypothetical protein